MIGSSRPQYPSLALALPTYGIVGVARVRQCTSVVVHGHFPEKIMTINIFDFVFDTNLDLTTINILLIGVTTSIYWVHIRESVVICSQQAVRIAGKMLGNALMVRNCPYQIR